MARRNTAGIAIAGFAATVVISFSAGCGGKNESSPVGSVPIKAVTIAPKTTTHEVRSSAMEPTLHCARPAVGCEADAMDRIVVDEPVVDPKRADILMVRVPPLAEDRCGASGIFVERLVGLPGETIEVKVIDGSDYIFVGGKKLDEPYIERRGSGPASAPRKIAEGEYYLLGDNRPQSCDSRVWGTVPRANLVGKVVQIERPAIG